MKKLITLALTLTVLVGCGAKAQDQKEEKENFYALTTVVTEIDEDNNLVICQDFSGNEWIFEGIEDWQVYDLCSMLMNDKGTECITDDIIESCRYGGTFGAVWGHE